MSKIKKNKVLNKYFFPKEDKTIEAETLDKAILKLKK